MIKQTFLTLTLIFLLLPPGDAGAQDPAQSQAQLGRESDLTQMIYRQGASPAPEPPPSDLQASGLQFRRDPFTPKLPPPPEPERTVPDIATQPSGIIPESTESSKSEEAPQISVPEMTITGIVWNTDRPQAIINGRVLDIGDSPFENIVITAIDKDTVELSIQGHAVVVRSGGVNAGQYVEIKGVQN